MEFPRTMRLEDAGEPQAVPFCAIPPPVQDREYPKPIPRRLKYRGPHQCPSCHLEDFRGLKRGHLHKRGQCFRGDHLRQDKSRYVSISGVSGWRKERAYKALERFNALRKAGMYYEHAQQKVADEMGTSFSTVKEDIRLARRMDRESRG